MRQEREIRNDLPFFCTCGRKLKDYKRMTKQKESNTMIVNHLLSFVICFANKRND